MTTLKLDGAEIAYRSEGNGQRTLALAHGWCSHSGHWEEIATRLSTDHRVLTWDRRGMGQSTSSAPAESAERHADDLAAILDNENMERTVLVAHAGAGPAALSFATKYSERIEALVMVDTGLYDPNGGPADVGFAEGVHGLIDTLSAPGSDEFLGETYGSFFGPDAPPELVQAACNDAVATDRAVAIEELRHVLADTKGLARQVKCPVLWVSASPDDTAMVEGLFEDLKIGHPVGSGHFVQVEVPDQFEAMLRTFLTQL